MVAWAGSWQCCRGPWNALRRDGLGQQLGGAVLNPTTLMHAPPRLAGRQLATLLSTLAFGLGEADAEVVQASLEALAALARFHNESAAAGRPGVPHVGGKQPVPLQSSVTVCVHLSAHVHAESPAG